MAAQQCLPTNKEKDELKDFTEMHCRELEKFNEQLSTITT